MSKSRRQFVSAGLLAATAACKKPVQKVGELPPGAPPAFGTAPDVGPSVTASTFAEAEKLMQIEMSQAELAQVNGSGLRASHRTEEAFAGCFSCSGNAVESRIY